MQSASFDRIAVINALALIVGTACGAGSDASPPDCREEIRADYAAAQREWQASLRDMISSNRPDLTELAGIFADLQLAMIDQASARFRFLLETAPDRIPMDRDLSAFVNTGAGWTADDESALANRDADYASLSARIDALRVRNDAHDDWPSLSTYVGTELATTSAYQTAMSALRQAFADLDARLESCSAGELGAG